MTTHRLEPGSETTHGYFSRDLQPVLTLEPGDSVAVKTLNAGWHRDPDPVTGHWDHEERVDWYDPDRDRGHALCGPIAVRGAEPDMTLEVRIDEVVPGSWGWSLGGGSENELNRALGVAGGAPSAMFWSLDSESGRARSREGYELAMRPFCGVMGMPPDEPGRHPTGPPRPCGGNIDCKELMAGTTLFLPIPVTGALFSIGDGHAVQGDGEVSGVAIECPLERVILTLSLLPDLRLAMPRALTPNEWLSFGFSADLDEAAWQATRGMMDLIAGRHDLDQKQALNLASLVADLRVTQIVNGVKGVHARLPHEAIASVHH